MSNNKQLEELFKHIQIGLNKCTVKELNEAIISFISTKYDKSHEIDYVFKIVSDDYNVNPEILKQKNVRGIYNEAKEIIYCILHFNMGLSIRYIAKYVFFNNHMTVHGGIKKFNNLNENFKQDKLFMERYNKLSGQFIEYFTKQKELA
jgi:chromosomal replication initiation ATPase DnaA